jgi:23S rRNA A2030 N6-methylase RlmJ
MESAIKGAIARKVTTVVIDALLKANMEVSNMPQKNGTTMHQRSMSLVDPMWMLPQQSVIMVKAVNNICIETSVHSKGNSVTANLLNTIKPTEHTIQQLTPWNISALSL